MAALRSEDPSRQVGAVAVRPDNRIGGTGYNGAPPGVKINWEDEEERLGHVIHAEENALRDVLPGECDRLYASTQPCGSCIRVAAAYGIKKIVYHIPYPRDGSSLKKAAVYGIIMQHQTDFEPFFKLRGK